ncbi:hypothetical protein MCOR32_010027 [Pyricularia oryzae]|nr:hypothetical protein MCOR32_010027 [Pyricularia oryzae]
MTDKPQQGLPPEQCQTAFWFIDPRQFSWEFCSIDNANQHPYMAARSYHRVVDLTSISRHLLWNTRTAICWLRIPPSNLIGYKQQLATIFSRPHGFDNPRPSTSANIVGVMESEFRTTSIQRKLNTEVAHVAKGAVENAFSEPMSVRCPSCPIS